MGLEKLYAVKVDKLMPILYMIQIIQVQIRVWSTFFLVRWNWHTEGGKVCFEQSLIQCFFPGIQKIQLMQESLSTSKSNALKLQASKRFDLAKELIRLCNDLVHGQVPVSCWSSIRSTCLVTCVMRQEAFPGAQPTSLTRQKVGDQLLQETGPVKSCAYSTYVT